MPGCAALHDVPTVSGSMGVGAAPVILVATLAAVALAIPVSAGAAAGQSSGVTITFVWGDGCPHCEVRPETSGTVPSVAVARPQSFLL